MGFRGGAYTALVRIQGHIVHHIEIAVEGTREFVGNGLTGSSRHTALSPSSCLHQRPAAPPSPCGGPAHLLPSNLNSFLDCNSALAIAALAATATTIATTTLSASASARAASSSAANDAAQRRPS